MPTKTEWIKVILELKKGPLSPSELQDKGISRRTVYRALEALENAGLAERREKKKYYWYEFSKRTFDSRDEYELAYDHSKKLRSMLDESILLGEKPFQKDERGILECALNHLRMYPKVFEILTECKRKKDEFSQREDEFKREIERTVEKSELQDILNEFPYLPKNIALVIVSSLKDLASNREPFFKYFRVEGESLFCGGYGLGPKKTEIEVRKLIERICQSKKLGRKLVELEDEYYRCKAELARELTYLANLIEHGTPLIGKCDLCPEIRIKAPRGGGDKHGSDPHR